MKKFLFINNNDYNYNFNLLSMITSNTPDLIKLNQIILEQVISLHHLI